VILLPAIDIRAGRAVRLFQGDYERETRYDANPVDAAKRWALEGARYLHVVDLDGAKAGRPMNLDVVARIAAAVSCPIEVGGGLRTPAAVASVLAAGAQRVVIGTAALRDPEFLEAMLGAYGERVIVSIDSRGGKVSLAGWTETTETEAGEAMSELAQRGVRRFLFTPIEVDGTMDGPGFSQLAEAASASEAALIYSGGVGELADLKALADRAPANVEGVIVGRAIYEQRFTVSQANAILDSP
jgi:phosphoribosylformimino-5-aminoimidazole carboxamide ribotide isomerase